MSEVSLNFDEAEATHITQRAMERGYTSAVAYLRALVAADTLVTLLREDWQNADDSPERIEADFREAWHDAMTGKVYPAETLWDDLDDDE